MKTIKFICLSLGLALVMTSCTENYSNGERIGMITKFSKKGLVFDSWEGTLNTTQTGMNSAQSFEFSVDNDINDPKTIAALDSAATFGWKVKIKYHETFGLNWFNNRGETNYFVNEVEVLDRAPMDSMFGNSKDSNEPNKGKVVDTIYVVIDKSRD
jgi:hypothetical protein